MLSTGFFLELKYTGKKVEINADTRAIPVIINTERKSKLNRDTVIPESLDTELLISPANTPVNIMDRIMHIAAMINASEKNILNTSVSLAPTARKIPISFFFAEIDAVIKLKSKAFLGKKGFFVLW